jgi:hypothetical protein
MAASSVSTPYTPCESSSDEPPSTLQAGGRQRERTRNVSKRMAPWRCRAHCTSASAVNFHAPCLPAYHTPQPRTVPGVRQSAPDRPRTGWRQSGPRPRKKRRAACAPPPRQRAAHPRPRRRRPTRAPLRRWEDTIQDDKGSMRVSERRRKPAAPHAKRARYIPQPATGHSRCPPNAPGSGAVASSRLPMASSSTSSPSSDTTPETETRDEVFAPGTGRRSALACARRVANAAAAPTSDVSRRLKPHAPLAMSALSCESSDSSVRRLQQRKSKKVAVLAT